MRNQEISTRGLQAVEASSVCVWERRVNRLAVVGRTHSEILRSNGSTEGLITTPVMVLNETFEPDIDP